MSADVLRDLARAKVAFQLRAICTVIGAPTHSPGDALGSIADTPSAVRSSSQDCRGFSVLHDAEK